MKRRQSVLKENAASDKRINIQLFKSWCFNAIHYFLSVSLSRFYRIEIKSYFASIYFYTAILSFIRTFYLCTLKALWTGPRDVIEVEIAKFPSEEWWERISLWNPRKPLDFTLAQTLSQTHSREQENWYSRGYKCLKSWQVSTVHCGCNIHLYLL